MPCGARGRTGGVAVPVGRARLGGEDRQQFGQIARRGRQAAAAVADAVERHGQVTCERGRLGLFSCGLQRFDFGHGPHTLGHGVAGLGRLVRGVEGDGFFDGGVYLGHVLLYGMGIVISLRYRAVQVCPP